MPFQPGHIAQGVGTVYVAPMGTTEPSSVTGAWPSGWSILGYTTAGSTFDDNAKFAGIAAEEEIYDLRQALTGTEATFTAELLEYNEQNILLAMNAGIGADVVPGAVTPLTDGSGDRIDNVTAAGGFARVMLGWDFLNKGTIQPSPGQFTYGRIVIRQALQTNKYQYTHRKGNHPTSISCIWTAEFPMNPVTGQSAGSMPYSILLPAWLRTS